VSDLEEMEDDDMLHFLIGWMTSEIASGRTPSQKVQAIRKILIRYHREAFKRGRAVGAEMAYSLKAIERLKHPGEGL
jgi:hypothetical protein